MSPSKFIGTNGTFGYNGSSTFLGNPDTKLPFANDHIRFPRSIKLNTGDSI